VKISLIFIWAILMTKSLLALSVTIEKSTQLYQPECRWTFPVKFLGVKNIPDNYSEIINEISVQHEGVADYSERFINSVVKCGYRIEIMLGFNLREDTIYAKKCFHKIEGTALVFAQYDSDKQSKFIVDSNSKIKNNVYRLNDRFYIWETGVCVPESHVFFDKVENKVKMQNLKKNSFQEVAVSNEEGNILQNNSDFKMYYANPGFLIKTKKCVQSDKCKKDEMIVVSKKRLTDAILRKNNLVLTTDDY